MSKVWLTSDTHFNHANIIRYAARPFGSVSTMNEVLIANWNRVVAPEDTVWHLGDVSFGPVHLAKVLVRRLNGHKILIEGNHDRCSRGAYRSWGFEQVMRKADMPFLGLRILLIHEREVLEQGYDLQFCGHVHERWTVKGKAINVGVDRWNYTPVGLDNLVVMAKALILNRP